MDSKENMSESNHASRSVMKIPETKCIQVFLNGDEHFQGCRCVVNSRYYRNLDMFLNYLTERLKPSFGAVRNIYTPMNGHPVIKIEDINNKHRYVVGGSEKFRKLDFGSADVRNRISKKTEKKSKNVFKVSKAKPFNIKSLNIRLFGNGTFKAKPIQVILLPQDLVNWEPTFKKIMEALNCGQVKRLYTLDGKPIQTIEDLASNQYYVVVLKHEVFKFGQYDVEALYDISSPKDNYISCGSSSVIPATFSSVDSCTSAQPTGMVQENSDNFNDVSSQGHEMFHISGSGYGNESDSPCPVEFDENSSIKTKIDLDDDFSGIFRSKVKNHMTAGAVEIEDSLETIVDVPVDFLDAEEIEDEMIPDVERSLQHLNLSAQESIVAYLPNVEKPNSNKRVSSSKYNIHQSHSIDIHDIFV